MFSGTDYPRRLELRSAIVRDLIIVSPDIKAIAAIAKMHYMRSGSISDRNLPSSNASQLDDLHQEVRSSCALVVEAEQLVGIFTERDVVRPIAEQRNLDTLTIRQVMTHPAIALHESDFTDVAIAMNLLQTHHIRHLPILDDRDRPVGLVTYESLLPALNLRECSDRQQLETAPQASEELLRLALELNHIGSWDWDLAAATMTWNDDNYRLFGYQRGEVEPSYQLWRARVHPDDIVEVEQKLAQALETQTDCEAEYRIVLSDGTVRWVLGKGGTVYNSAGQPIWMMGVAYDISDRKQAELELQRSNTLCEQLNQELEAKVAERTASLLEKQRLIAQITESTTAILYIFDLQKYQNIYANGQISEVLGYSPEEIQAMGSNLFPQLVHPDDLPMIMRRVEQCFTASDSDVIEVEYRMRHANGEWRWLQSRDKVFKRTAEGAVWQIIGTAVDISDRKATEIALSESESRFQRLAANVPGMIYQYILHSDGSDTFTYVSPQCRNIYELEPEELLRDFSRVWTMIHPEDKERVHQSNIKSAQQLERFDVEFRLLPASGVLRWVRAISQPESQANGDVIWAGFVLDITNRKLIEEQLQQLNQELETKVQERTVKLQETHQKLLRANRLKDEFLANMSHELRTPLNVILGVTEGIQEEVFGEIDQGQRKALQTIERSGSHLLELINDILDLAKVESGQMTLQCKPTAIAPLCKASWAFVQQQAFQKNIQLKTKLPPNLPDLCVDERRIRQVLINLLSNAVKFTLEEGCITLAVSQVTQVAAPNSTDPARPPQLQIAVTDTGIGIAVEDISKLFQPFTQIDSDLSRKYEGSGLGLSLVKRIVELHGGRVGVASTLGVGTCFAIDLPCVSSAPSSLPQNPPNDPGSNTQPFEWKSSSPLILLAEDNEANIYTTASYLRAKGYRILVANNGREAIALAQSQYPDLILMDVHMPEMDGIAAISQIRQDPNLVNVPIIALTARAMAGDRARCLVAGANDYLSKPVKLKELTYIIQQLLTSKGE